MGNSEKEQLINWLESNLKDLYHWRRIYNERFIRRRIRLDLYDFYWTTGLIIDCQDKLEREILSENKQGR